jgi:hypothetical protein
MLGQNIMKFHLHKFCLLNGLTPQESRHVFYNAAMLCTHAQSRITNEREAILQSTLAEQKERIRQLELNEKKYGQLPTCVVYRNALEQLSKGTYVSRPRGNSPTQTELWETLWTNVWRKSQHNVNHPLYPLAKNTDLKYHQVLDNGKAMYVQHPECKHTPI